MGAQFLAHDIQDRRDNVTRFIALGRAEIFNLVLIAGYAALAWFAPNTQAIMGYDHARRTVGESMRQAALRPWFLYATSAVLAFGILGIQQHSEFIYFRF